MCVNKTPEMPFFRPFYLRFRKNSPTFAPTIKVKRSINRGIKGVPHNEKKGQKDGSIWNFNYRCGCNSRGFDCFKEDRFEVNRAK